MREISGESLLPKHRLESLTDGIFAITMTLIILDLKAPENIPSNLAEQEVPAMLINMFPDVEAYAISFIVLGIFWLRHQIQFRYIKSVSRFLIGINVIFLMLIGFVPFSVGLLMKYSDFSLPFRIYVINLLLISILLFFHMFYCVRKKVFLVEDFSQVMQKRFIILSVVPGVIFAMSLIASFINLRVAFSIIYLDPLFYIFYRRILRR